jgi:hypothetical protein
MAGGRDDSLEGHGDEAGEELALALVEEEGSGKHRTMEWSLAFVLLAECPPPFMFALSSSLLLSRRKRC